MSRSRNGRKQEQLATPVFILIICTTLCTFLVGQGTNAGTSVYLEKTGGEVWLAGIGALCFSVAAGTARLIAGPLADSKGRQLVILTGSIIMLIGCICPIFANNRAYFILWRLLQGAGFSASTTALATAAADVLPISRLGEGIGYYGLGQAISMSIGPALAIFLISTDTPSNFYVGCAVCSLTALALSIFIRYEKNPLKLPSTCDYRTRFERRAESAPNATSSANQTTNTTSNKDHQAVNLLLKVFEPKALHGAIPVAFMCAAFSFNIFYMGVFGNFIGASNPGLYYTICAISMIVIRLVSGRFMDKVASLTIMGVAVGSGVITFAMLFICSINPDTNISEMMFYIAGIPFGICMGLGIPINQTISVKASPGDRWGAANGLFQLAIDLANGLLSVVWGFLAGSIGFGGITLCIIGLLILSFFSAILTYPKARNHSK